MVSVLPTVVTTFKRVLEQERKPNGMINMRVKDLKNGLKLQNRIAQKDFLEVSLKKNLFPKEVTLIAKKLSKG